MIMREWGEKEGAIKYKKNRSGEIIKSAAQMAGLKIEDIQLGMKTGSASPPKKPVGVYIG